MSDAPVNPAAPPFFRAWSFLGGFVLGLLGLVWAGHAITHRTWHKEFTRIHPMIGPEAMYEPSVNEMRAIVRSRCQRDQILVIVAGNSILLGVGQPPEQLWTRRLQEALGSRYAVVNLAFRGAEPTDGGAVVAESLRDEFPRQIVIANAAVMQAADAAGSGSYRFITLDAYYKNLLLPWAPRDEEIRQLVAKSNEPEHVREMLLGARADAMLRFHDFWNGWSYTRGFTFPTSLSPETGRAFSPRARFKDEEPDYNAVPFAQRFAPEHAAADKNIVLTYSAAGYEKGNDGQWHLQLEAREGFTYFAQRCFPDALKPRTLILVSRNSPYYTRQLPADLQERDDTAVRDTIAGWEKFGYSSMDYGADFDPADFGDRTHLTTSGGAKLAKAVAPKVRAMAEKLGYLKP